MGCDIHMFVEYRKVGDIGQWEADERQQAEHDYGDNGEIEYTHYGDCDQIGRDYKLFGFLAGVRGGMSSCIFDPRGMPEDASDYVKAACEKWGVDGHSHHYLTFTELYRVIDEYRASEVEEARQDKQDTSEAKRVYQNLLDYIEEGRAKRKHLCPEGLFDLEADARVVFWFDN